jgi:hypothetical protein
MESEFLIDTTRLRSMRQNNINFKSKKNLIQSRMRFFYCNTKFYYQILTRFSGAINILSVGKILNAL